jgi:4-amino-4-deoxy-L-arabinose transferase-like glycosyltransferase
VNHPIPAIVAQRAVRRLPRAALLLLCAAYVITGFIGRNPWKNADITALGYMMALLADGADWMNPRLLGLAPEVEALLPYWLGAWAIKLAPSFVPLGLAARIPFALLLLVTLAATWYGTYQLARSPRAQPVAFAFGGEAQPADYARAMADGALLALLACLGLAQLSHETTPAAAQLCFTALAFYASARLTQPGTAPILISFAALLGLALSGAPALAMLFGLGGVLMLRLDPSNGEDAAPVPKSTALQLGGVVLLIGAVATALDLWRWRVELPGLSWNEWRSLGRLLLWFTWPAWPLALWTVWRWRHQVLGVQRSRHLLLPLWYLLVTLGCTLTTRSADRSLLLALPALAALAAFALPTLKRGVSAVIDWFTLLFFSGCGIIVWVIWIAMQTGIPRQPAANVARLAPGFEHEFSSLPFVLAVLATLAWGGLVKWRVGRHPAAIWKSLVLPAGGAVLCWVLVLTLWLPLLDYARSYAPMMQQITRSVPSSECVEVLGLSRSQIAALQFHSPLNLHAVGDGVQCPVLLANGEALTKGEHTIDTTRWALWSSVRRPTDRNEIIQIYRRGSLVAP